MGQSKKKIVMPHQPKVSIITVNFRQFEMTVDFLDSLKDSTYSNLEVIVVENGWKEDHDESYRKVYPEVVVLHSHENLGFAGGNNLGIKASTGDYLFFLNNDTEVPADTIAKLVEEMESDPKTGVICPRIYYYDQPEILQYAGFTPMNWWTAQNHANHYKEALKLEDKTTATAFAHGAAMLISRQAINQSGLMPENYFLYYEELDWVHHICKKGYGVKVHHGTYILHKESVSTGKASALKTYFQTRNRILFMRRNAGLKKWMFFLFFAVAVLPVHILRYGLDHKWGHIKSLIAGTWWNLRHSTTSREIGYVYHVLRYS
jgi:GT2 family glycosyltransferase